MPPNRNGGNAGKGTEIGIESREKGTAQVRWDPRDRDATDQLRGKRKGGEPSEGGTLWSWGESKSECDVVRQDKA